MAGDRISVDELTAGGVLPVPEIARAPMPNVRKGSEHIEQPELT
jgi:hypothetical protein